MNIFKKSKKKYISLDVFDTILFRDVPYEQIFCIVEKKLVDKYGDNFINFSRNRIECQKKAQNGVKVEATLDDIYDLMDYNNDIKDKIKKIEIETELEHLHVNNVVKKFIEKSKNEGKTIIITSDMYLSKESISYILNEKGIVFDKIYVSSDVQKRKSSGKLFLHIIKDLGIRKKDLIHIGDNIKSDYIIPKLLFIEAILIKRKEDKHSLDNEELKKIIDSNYQDDYYKELGFKCFGPLLYGFCIWINDIIEKQKLDDLCFLSRDGLIVSKAYKIIFPDSNYPYFLGSRRALTVPLLTNVKNFNDILKIVPYIKREENVDDLLAKLGIYDETTRTLIKNKYGSTISREELKGTKGEEIFKIIEHKMKDNAAEEKKNSKKYIDNNLKKGKIGLVDIGWYGTMQLSLEKLCKENDLKRSFYGIYLGFLKRDDNHNLDAKGYIYDYNSKNQFDDELVFGFNGLIELMFTANHGSAKRYVLENNKPDCQLDEECGEYSEFVKKVQFGALDFVKIAKEHKLVMSRNDAYKNILRLLTAPSIEECYIIGEEKFYDIYFEKIIQFNNWFDIFKNPRNSVKSFLKSNWKIGYIKKMGFPFPKAVYKLLNLLKR